jgi:hypothetical protein
MPGKVVFVVGVGRSGTSVFAKWLDACGLAAYGRTSTVEHINPTGNFEDEDMFDLHVALLRASGLRSWLDATSETAYVVPDVLRREAERVGVDLRRAAESEPVMVKNPLASNFLPLWGGILGEQVRFVVVYRHPLLVVESIRKLRKRNQHRRRNRVAAWARLTAWRTVPPLEQRERDRALQTWMSTNERILSWADEQAVAPIFVNSEHWPKEDRDLLERITAGMDGVATFRPASELLRPGYFDTSPPIWRGNKSRYADALAVFDRLEARRLSQAVSKDRSA